METAFAGEQVRAVADSIQRWVESTLGADVAGEEVQIRVLFATGVDATDPEWLRALVRRFSRRRVHGCAHARSRPQRPGVAFAGEGFLRCLPCLARYLAVCGDLPDMTCGGCGAGGELAVLCVEARVSRCVYTGLCVGCEAQLRSGGDS